MIRSGPGGEFGFDRGDDFVQPREITVVEAASTREFPNTLRGIQLRTVGWQEVQGEAIGVMVPPFTVKSGVVVFCIIGNYDHPSSGAGAGRPQIFQEAPRSEGIELGHLSSKKETAIAHPDSPEVAYALASRVMEQDGIPGFARDPHPAA